jgi:hypothetical protein
MFRKLAPLQSSGKSMKPVLGTLHGANLYPRTYLPLMDPSVCFRPSLDDESKASMQKVFSQKRGEGKCLTHVLSLIT